jgi:hypothetical protein
MTTTVFVVGFAILFLMVVALLRRPEDRSPAAQVRRFEQARAVTLRWSEDPSSTPAPLRELAAGHLPPEDGPS